MQRRRRHCEADCGGNKDGQSVLHGPDLPDFPKNPIVPRRGYLHGSRTSVAIDIAEAIERAGRSGGILEVPQSEVHASSAIGGVRNTQAFQATADA